MKRSSPAKRFLYGALASVFALYQTSVPAFAAYNAPTAIGQFTGDCTTASANSYVTTCSKYNGGTSFGSMAGQSAGSVAITGGTITGTPISGSTISGTTGTFSGVLTSAGRVSAIRILTSGTSTTLAATDEVVCINKTTGSATSVTGPASPVIGQTYVIKDCKGDANSNNITFTPSSGTVDGASSYVLTQAYQAVNIVYTSSTTANIF